MMQDSAKKTILVTGGTGYIGSHTVVELLQKEHRLVVLDNLQNSSSEVIARIKRITGQQVQFVQGDVRDAELLNALFAEHRFGAVIHFAGLKSVGESVDEPILYYQNNVAGSLSLFRCMAQNNCKNLVFSSSATVYGDPQTVPVTEDAPLSSTNPYGQSKLMIEHILRDLSASDPEWRISLLRYFNPVAAHPSGLLGEDPKGVPNNLLPYIAKVAVGELEQLTIHGNDYPTQDGTGVRDYIHVVDLAQAHVAALKALARSTGCEAINIGTGQGYSVMEMINAFEQASGKKIAFRIGPRRAGDIASCFAHPGKAEQVLGWRAKADLTTMMEDHWRWQSMNPQGYAAT
jgi:UDP-glucose 4-epimerase